MTDSRFFFFCKLFRNGSVGYLISLCISHLLLSYPTDASIYIPTLHVKKIDSLALVSFAHCDPCTEILHKKTRNLLIISIFSRYLSVSSSDTFACRTCCHQMQPLGRRIFGVSQQGRNCPTDTRACSKLNTQLKQLNARTRTQVEYMLEHFAHREPSHFWSYGAFAGSGNLRGDRLMSSLRALRNIQTHREISPDLTGAYRCVRACKPVSGCAAVWRTAEVIIVPVWR